MGRGARRGGEAVEFALLLPVFMALFGGIFEYSWYFFMRATVADVARDACRAGALIPPNSIPDAETVARDSIIDAMGGWDFFNMDCADPSSDTCEIGITEEGEAPSGMMVCAVRVAYPGLTGMLPVPDHIEAQVVSLYELQR
jgi:hypothetical protein